jgi:hypothetical protein
MKLLVDASFPRTLVHAPNSQGIEILRVEGDIGDDQLPQVASQRGCGGIVVAGHEMFTDLTLTRTAADLGIALFCSVEEDPFAAENSLRSALPQVQRILAHHTGGAWWLYRGGRLAQADLPDA